LHEIFPRAVILLNLQENDLHFAHRATLSKGAPDIRAREFTAALVGRGDRNRRLEFSNSMATANLIMLRYPSR
jgi:hypothetical protein